MRKGKELRIKMTEFDLTQSDLGKAINRSPSYISRRMTQVEPWDQDDIYAICDYVNSLAAKNDVKPMPYGDIYKYFPPRQAR